MTTALNAQRKERKQAKIRKGLWGGGISSLQTSHHGFVSYGGIWTIISSHTTRTAGSVFIT